MGHASTALPQRSGMTCALDGLDNEAAPVAPQDMYSTIDDAVKLVIANKVDRTTEREVTFEQGAAFAKKVSADGAVTQRMSRVSTLLLHRAIPSLP